MFANITHDTKAEHRRLMVCGVVFLTILALLVALSIAVYDKAFTHYTTVTVKAENAGLQLPQFGDVRRHQLARVRLQSLVSQYGWSLWGAIQSAASSIDFDFYSWGKERFDKADRTFRSPDFERLLEDVTGDD